MYTLIAYFVLLSWLPLYSAEKSVAYNDMTFHFQPEKSSYKCSKCSIKPFTRASFLIRHAACEHTYCQGCNKECNNLQSIYNHIQKNHSQSSDYTPATTKLFNTISEYNFYNKAKEIIKPTKKARSQKHITTNKLNHTSQSSTDSHKAHSLPNMSHIESYLSNEDLNSIPIKKDIILECLHQILNDDPRLPILPTLTTGFLSYCK